MKHLHSFENNDYLSILRSESDLRKRLEEGGVKKTQPSNHLNDISIEGERRRSESNRMSEQKEIMFVVSTFINYCNNGKEGFSDFKEELKKLIDRYPPDSLPKSGYHIYQNK